jgi:3-hydroxy-9,10-secoandrosta-1,3,5(10)-triene-9,17-dione monooxygenase reductase component
MTDTSFDRRLFRNVLGNFATGVVAITAIEPETDRPGGLAANSFTSVSLDPPLVAFCVAKTSTSWPRMRDAERLCINVLAEHQEAICRQLAIQGGEKFRGLLWRRSPYGAPVLEDAVAWLEVSIEAEHPAGDHVIVVARVHDLRATENMPLLFFRGSYMQLRPGRSRPVAPDVLLAFLAGGLPVAAGIPLSSALEG